MGAWQAATAWWGVLALGLHGHLDNLIWGSRVHACSHQGWSMLNKNTILLRVWTLALEPYAKHYKATEEHHMILNRGRQQERNPRQVSGEINLSHSIQWRWHKKDTGGKFIGHEIVRQIVARKDYKHSSKITRTQFIYWQRMLAGGMLTTVVSGSQCIYMQCQNEQTNKTDIQQYTKQISIQNVSSSPLW